MRREIVAAVMAGSMAVVACGGGAVTASTTSAQPDTDNGEGLCQPSDPACTGPLAAGTHTTGNLVIPVTFTVPEGWSKTLDVPGSVNLRSDAFADAHIGILPDWVIASQEQCVRDPEPGLGRTVDDLVAFVTGHPGLITSTPSAVTIGNREGQTVDVRKDPDWSGPCPDRVSLFSHRGTIDDQGWWDIYDTMRFRLHFLDAGDGHTVTVHVETWDDTSFEDFVAAAQPVVESFEFGTAKTSG